MKRYAPRNRDKLIERQGLNAIHYKIKTLKTAKEKREMIRERNPLLYAFGEKLIPINHYTKEYANE